MEENISKFKYALAKYISSLILLGGYEYLKNNIGFVNKFVSDLVDKNKDQYPFQPTGMNQYILCNKTFEANEMPKENIVPLTETKLTMVEPSAPMLDVKRD